MPQPTFGIEEEFVLLDPMTLTTIDLAPAAILELRAGEEGDVGKEFFASQVEFASPVLSTAAEALETLRDFRTRLDHWADDNGVLAAGTGTPFRTRPQARISADERYERIADDVSGVTPDHQINGLHVHVGIPDAEAGVRASNELRAWLPVLLALSANSPFWQGQDTGFDSWRAIHSRRWTTYGVPPRFRDAADHDAVVEALTGVGATSDPGTINWNVRLSSRYPTVEVRVFDAQLDPSSSVALAVITRALVTSAERAPSEEQSGCLDLTDAALWHAARYGVRETLVHPQTNRLVSAAGALDALRERVEPSLFGPDERALVDELLDRTRRGGTGAALQRRASASGRGELAELLRRRLADTDPLTRSGPAQPLAAGL